MIFLRLVSGNYCLYLPEKRMNLSNFAHLPYLNIYEYYDHVVIKWHYNQTEGIYFVPGIEYSKVKEKNKPAYESEQVKVSGEIRDNVRMHDNVWWLIWPHPDSTNARTASIRYRLQRQRSSEGSQWHHAEIVAGMLLPLTKFYWTDRKENGAL